MPRTEPGGPRPRAADELLRIDAAGRGSRRMALAAIVLSVAGLGLAAWAALAPADGGCQGAAWSAAPATADLPAGWSVAGSQYDIARKSMSIVGPLPEDPAANQPVVIATITCYPAGATEAVTRSADAATAAGQAVTSRNDLGDQGFSAVDDSGATFLQFRRDRLVVYLAASVDVRAAEVDVLASAFDRALGGDGGAVAVGTADPGTPAPTAGTPAPTPFPSDGASPGAAAAPDLVALLPTQVGDVALLVDSATGSMMLGEDSVSRAIAAALRADGRAPDDLGVAQAADETLESDLSILAVRVKGMAGDRVLALVLSSWLSATGAGVESQAVTLAGRAFTRYDYGDGGRLDYVTTQGDVVIVITTADPDVAALAAAALR